MRPPGRFPSLLLVLSLVLASALLLSGAAGLIAQAPPGTEEPAAEEEGPAVPELEGIVSGSPFEASTWTTAGQRIFTRFVDALPNLFYALIVLVAFFLLYLGLRRILSRMLERRRSDPALRDIAQQLLKYTLIVIAVLMAAGQLGFRIGPLLASAGVLGLAVGLAAQDSLSNVIAGLILLWDRPFRTGDNVTIADTFGEVLHVGLRATHIRTVDDRDAYLPNRLVVDAKIVNHTQSPSLRLDVPLGIAYGEDIREARRVLLAAVDGYDRIFEKPAPEVVVTALADSSVNLELRVWLRDPKQERRALVELLEAGKLALDDAGIEIPFPQRTLHFADGDLAAAVPRHRPTE